ncbi:MAG TPA: hypothetical protein VK975_01275 [Acidimicrobiales bacterium]|nr:hypothetical protein [Acidimicrobiales bacterium]
MRRDQIAAFLARKLDRLVERSRVGRPPTAQVVVTPLTVAAGGTLRISITATRGLLDKATVTGCGASAPPAAGPVGNPTPTLSFDVTVPPTQAGRSCTLVVRTTLEDANTGESLEQRHSVSITVT